MATVRSLIHTVRDNCIIVLLQPRSSSGPYYPCLNAQDMTAVHLSQDPAGAYIPE